MKIGDRVYHKLYGEGTIIFDDGDTSNIFLVKFDNGNRILYPKYVEFYPILYCNKSDLIKIDEITIHQLLLCKER